MEETQPNQMIPEVKTDEFEKLFCETFTNIDSLCETLLQELEEGGYDGETIFVTVDQGGKQIYSQEEAIFPKENGDSLTNFVTEVKDTIKKLNNSGGEEYTLSITK